MRISDWSSDVCSSDLRDVAIDFGLDLMLGERGIVVQIALRPFAAPPLCMKPGVDDQPRRAPRLIGQHPEQLIRGFVRSEEHTSELQSLMRISYAVFCLKKKTKRNIIYIYNTVHKKTKK